MTSTKEQKVVILERSEEVNTYLKDGWQVVSVTAGHVDAGGTSFAVYGKFCFVIERNK